MSKKLIKEFIIHKGSFEQIKDHIGKNELGFAVDKGLPIPTPEDENKFLVVDAEGNYSLASKQLSRKYIYSTLETFRDAINYDYENLEGSIKYTLSYITNEKTGLKINAKFLEIGSDFYLTEKNVPDYWLVQKEIIVNENETFDPLLFFQEHETKYYEPIKYFTGIALENYEWSEGELVYCIENSTNFIRGSYYYHDGIKVHKVSTKDDVDSMSTELKKNINTKLDKSEFNTFKDNLNSVLENIQPSAIVDVDELVYPGWSGTAVPNSGYVESVYFNTELSVDEVLSIIESANIELFGGMAYFPLMIEGQEEMIQLMYMNGMAMINTSAGRVFSSSEEIGAGFVGWNSEFNGVISYNANALPTYTEDGETFEIVGVSNDKLSSLFSTTPFVKGEEPKDDVFYRVAGKGGTTVPNSGLVENLYFNTKLTSQEYYNILSNITFTPASVIGLSGWSFYAVMAYLVGQVPYVLAFKKFSDNDIDFAIINFSNMQVLQVIYVGDEGWQFFENPYNIGYEALNSLSGLPIGSENDKLKDMISILPFDFDKSIYSYKDGEYKKVLQEGDPQQQQGIEYIEFETNSTVSNLVITQEDYNKINSKDNIGIKLINVNSNFKTSILLHKGNTDFDKSSNTNAIVFFGFYSMEGLGVAVNSIAFLIINNDLSYNYKTIIVGGPYEIQSFKIQNDKLLISGKTSTGSDFNYGVNIDTTPTNNTNNLISSGAVYTALQNVKAELEEKTPDITVNTTLPSDTQELENIKVGDTTYEIPQTDFVLRDEVTNPDASYLSELQLGESVWQIPHVNFVLRDEVSENTTQQLKELEINGDKWKVSMSKEEIFEMISEYIDTNFENGDEGSY